MPEMTVAQYRVAAHPFRKYAWPGGYPVFAITSDGGSLCFDCLKTERRAILEAIRNKDNTSGWRVVAFAINWEDRGLTCDNCSQEIESAYGE